MHTHNHTIPIIPTRACRIMRASFMLLILALSGCITSQVSPEKTGDALDSTWAFEYSLRKHEGHSAFLVTLEAQAETACNGVVEAAIHNQDSAIDGFMAISHGEFVGLVRTGDERNVQMNGLSIHSALDLSSDGGWWTMGSGANNMTLQAGQSMEWWIVTASLSAGVVADHGLLLQFDCKGKALLTFENTTDAGIVAMQEFEEGLVGHDPNAQQDMGFAIQGRQTFQPEYEHSRLGLSVSHASTRSGEAIIRTPLQEVEHDISGSDPLWMQFEDGPGEYLVELNIVSTAKGSSYVAWSSFQDRAVYVV